MKRVLLLIFVLAAWLPASARTESRLYRVTFEHPTPNCPVVVGEIPAWVESARVVVGGRELPVQYDKALGEVAFLVDVAEVQRCRLVLSSKPARRVWPAQVNAQMWRKNADKSLAEVDTIASDQDNMYHRLHHHGPAFESSRAAYRVYFDKKQTIDTYGKRLPRLELRETMWYPTDEQLAADYGQDNLRVFGSIGVGTLKGWDAKKGKMVHITDFHRREARIVAHGPLRTIVEMRVEGWRYEGREITMTSRYILYADHDDVAVENRFEGDVEGLRFTTGVMKIAGCDVLRRAGVVAVCGEDFPENDTLKWQRERVALATAVPTAQVVAEVEDKTSYLFLLQPDTRGHIDYRFTMWWRRSRWLSDLSDEELLPAVADAIEAAAPARVERLR